MSEELNRHEAELNKAELENASGIENTLPQLSDAELEGASGGEKVGITEANPLAGARCKACKNANLSKSNCTHVSELKRYIMANGIKSVPSWKNCPYLNS